MTAPVTVLYGRDADAATVARAASRALEGLGVWVMVSETEDGDEAAWLVEHGNPKLLGQWLLPGQRLVVEHGGTWGIEDAPAAEAS